MKKIKANYLIYISLVLIFLVTRLINLDSDIPLGWSIINYQHFDEFFYTVGAINLNFYSTFTPNLFGNKFEIFWGSIPFWDLLVLLFYKIAGTNIFSVRILSVIFGLAAYIIYIKTLLKLCSNYYENIIVRVVTILFVLYPLFDPLFYYSNVIHEPSVYRLFIINLIIYVALEYEKFNFKFLSIILGLLSSFAFFFIYPQNLFISLFSLLFLFLYIKKTKAYLLYIFSFMLIGLIWLLFYKILYENSLVYSINSLINSGRVNISLFSVKNLKEISKIFFSNFVILSPIFSAFFYSFLFLYASNIRLFNRNKKIQILILFFITFIFQSLFSIDYIERKGIILLMPFLLFFYLIYYEQFFVKFKHTPLFYIPVLLYLIVLYNFINWWTSSSTVGTSFFNLNFISPNLYLLLFIATTLLIFLLIIINKPKYMIFITVAMLFYNFLFLNKFRMTKINTFSEIQKRVSKLPPGYVVSGFSYAFPSSSKELKPFLYYYYPKIHGYRITKNDLNDLETLTFDKFLSSSSLPVYTIVQDTIPVMKNYPASKIIFHESNYNDVESYYSLFDTSYITKFKSQRNIFLIQLNAKK